VTLKETLGKEPPPAPVGWRRAGGDAIAGVAELADGRTKRSAETIHH
jgi:hypothetical protein